ncbi:MAG: hypothetical protein IK115_08355, partial [Lachnospiraceae bacterium]|nr:hypothetical protein [Lachnospiraceae bacterium]
MDWSGNGNNGELLKTKKKKTEIDSGLKEKEEQERKELEEKELDRKSVGSRYSEISNLNVIQNYELDLLNGRREQSSFIEEL